MRAVFLLLVLANVAYFVWARHLTPGASAHDSPASRELNPNMLKLVPPTRPAGEPPPPRPQAAAPLTVAAGCLEWGPLAPTDARRAEKWLEPLALGERLVQHRTEEIAAWWVFMPPQGSRQAALRKSAELKALGVHDYYVIAEDGKWRWALSLGLFRSEVSAQARLATLRAQGVSAASVAPRETVLPKVWLRIRNVDAALETQLRELAPTFEGSELRACLGVAR